MEWVHQSNGDADALLLLLLQFCHQWDQRRTGRSSVHACKERERGKELKSAVAVRHWHTLAIHLLPPMH